MNLIHKHQSMGFNIPAAFKPRIYLWLWTHFYGIKPKNTAKNRAARFNPLRAPYPGQLPSRENSAVSWLSGH
jgi:hypothetical protein